VGDGDGRGRRGPWSHGYDSLSAWGRAEADALLGSALAGRGVAGEPALLWDAGSFVYRVGDVVAKVYSPDATVDRYEQTAVAAHALAAAGVPLVAPLDDGRLLRSDVGSIGFWPFIAAVRAPDWRDVGWLLRTFHATAPDVLETVALPRWDGLVGTRWATSHYRARSDADSRLADAIDATGERLTAAAAPLQAEPVTLIHGDAQLQNVLVGVDGPQFVDLDWLAIGPRAADAVAVVRAHRHGTLDDVSYAAFVDAYGSDPASLDGMDVLSAAKDLGEVTFQLALACRRGADVGWLADAVGPLLV
jgi:hypothetical protein